MAELRRAAIAVRVLVPEEALVIARPADLERVPEGHVLAGRVQHQVHPAADPLADRVHVGDLLADRRASPAVDLERRIAELETLLGEVREGLRAGQAVRLVVAVIRARIRRQALLVAAEEPVDRRVVELAREVPQRDIHRRVADPGHLPQGPVDVRVDAFAFERVLAEQVLDEHRESGEIQRRGARIFANDPHVGQDPEHGPVHRCRGARLVDHVEAVVVAAEIGQGRGVLVDLDAGDLGIAHRSVLRSGWQGVVERG